ncbi:hypothetical protein GCM10009827_085030 [Dactylosporangium maewongense]|uniref:DUF4419 domain-containing protein n=1 Tax=Dactylosporangium maewongense TaxID=634393 RepID=A0ABN2C7B2_9ACTN
MVTFGVDDVTPAAAPLPTRPLGGLFPDTLAVGGDLGLTVLEPDGVHPLLSAVARAFADHRPLVLSPDAVWLTIAQGVAQHIRLHAEELRPLLVRHAGRKKLAVSIDGPVPQDAASWATLTDEFAGLLAKEIEDAELFECDFSTSTPVERTAGRVVLLDAYSPYFALWLVAVCGIPSVTLTGTVEDWRRIRGRVDALPRFGLDSWCRSLAPILDEFVGAASGAPDVAFWQRIYSPVDAYGGEVITGWVTRFYPYLAGSAVDRPNPMLDLPVGEPRDVPRNQGPGIRSSSVPATLSRVVVHVNDQIGGDNGVVALHAGLVAVAQDPDGALRPVAGWHLATAALEIDDVIDRLVREHDTTPADEGADDAPEEVVALYHRVGTATLFDGAWRLPPARERRSFLTSYERLWASTLFELADGRSIAMVVQAETLTASWVLCRIEQPQDPDLLPWLADDPTDVPVLGTSLAILLSAALDSGGDVAHLETGRLSQLGQA